MEGRYREICRPRADPVRSDAHSEIQPEPPTSLVATEASAAGECCSVQRRAAQASGANKAAAAAGNIQRRETRSVALAKWGAWRLGTTGGAGVAGRFIRGRTISHSLASESKAGTRLAGLETAAAASPGPRGRVSERHVTSKRNGMAAPAKISGWARRACVAGSAMLKNSLGSKCGT